MTTEDLFTYLRRSPATSELSSHLSQVVEQRRALNRLAEQGRTLAHAQE